MKITQDVRDYAAQIGVSETEALERGMERKSGRIPAGGRGALLKGLTENQSASASGQRLGNRNLSERSGMAKVAGARVDSADNTP